MYSDPRILDLVERHRYGDVDAFEEIYERYEAMVFNLAWRLCGDPTEAQDLAQEAFLRVYRHLERFQGRSSLKTWIYRVALNTCRSSLGRKKWRSVPLAEEEGAEGLVLVDTRRTPEERAVATSAGEQVLESLALIPRKFREAVVLRDLEGLTYTEMADVLGVRIGTVRSRIARGRKRLRDLMETRA